MTDFKAKCTKFDFGCGSAPDPAGGAYSDPQDPLAGFGAASRQGEGLGWGRGWKGEGGGSGGEGKGGPQVTVELGPLRALLCHWLLVSIIVSKKFCHNLQRLVYGRAYAGPGLKWCNCRRVGHMKRNTA